jgi:hypothetical protein
MKRSLLAAALLLCSLTANADDLRAGTKQLSFFITDPSFTESHSQGSDVSGGAGLAFSYVFAPQWSAQLSVAAQEHRDVFTRSVQVVTDPNGTVLYAPVTTVENVRTYPIELLGKYHFLNESRWTPFLGAGVRYVQAPDVPSQFQFVTPPPSGIGVPTLFTGGARYGNRTSAEVAGGVALRITPKLSLDLEARRLLRSDGVAYDPVNRGVIGVSWRF